MSELRGEYGGDDVETTARYDEAMSDQTGETRAPAFTPGPWKLEQVDDGVSTQPCVTARDGTYIVTALIGTMHEDARLIAAAPELLEALRWLEYEASCLMCGGGRRPLKDKVSGEPCKYNFHNALERAVKAIEAAGSERDY